MTMHDYRALAALFEVWATTEGAEWRCTLAAPEAAAVALFDRAAIQGAQDAADAAATHVAAADTAARAAAALVSARQQLTAQESNPGPSGWD